MTKMTQATPVRATDLRALGVKYGTRTIETVECLAYNHEEAQVVGIHLKGVDSDLERRVRFESMDLSNMAAGELRLEPPVRFDGGELPKAPIDEITLKLPSGQTAYVTDGLIDPVTGKLIAYEVGLTPQAEQCVEVKPAEITIVQGRWSAGQDVEDRLQHLHSA